MAWSRVPNVPPGGVDAVFAFHSKEQEVEAHLPHLIDGKLAYPDEKWVVTANPSFHPKRFGLTHNLGVVINVDEGGQPRQLQGFAFWTWYPGDLKGSVDEHLAKYKWEKRNDDGSIWTGTRATD